MSRQLSVVVTLDGEVHDPETPLLLASRGDTLDVRAIIRFDSLTRLWTPSGDTARPVTFVDSATLAPNIFVSLGASVRGWRVVEVPVTHLPRETGTVSLRTLKLLRFSLRGLAQLVAFRVRLARTGSPDGARGGA